MAATYLSCGCPAEKTDEDCRQKLLETLHHQGKSSGDKIRFLQRLKKVNLRIDLGGETEEDMVFDEANERYMSRHFSNLDDNVYCIPPYFAYDYPEEPSDLILEYGDDGLQASSVDRGYDTLKRKRKGELAEEVIVNRFLTMLMRHKIPSFVIHGYAWRAKFIGNLKKLNKDFQKLSVREGEIDLLISIPGQCVIVMEVKAVSDVSNVTGVVNKAFKQSTKTFEFLSMVMSDFCEDNKIPVMKTVVIPNCKRESIQGLFCQSCLIHIVAEDDLETVESLYCWFTKLLRERSLDSQFGLIMHRSLIGRLIGPASLLEIKTIPESIQKTVSQLNKQDSKQIVSRWCQLNPVQLSVTLRQQKFLWITGVPGSGKTVLGLSKAEEIAQDSSTIMKNELGQGIQTIEKGLEKVSTGCVLYVLNGFSPTFAPSCLLNIYKERLTNASENCDVFILDLHELEKCDIRRDLLSKCQKLPHVISMLQRMHKDKIVHIIVEECQMVRSDLDENEFKKEWRAVVDDERLGIVWLIQSSFITGAEARFPALPGFHNVHLERIMRMSKQNVEFVNIFLAKQYRLGHGVTGNRPVIYRMKCICKDYNDHPRTDHCFVCHVIRVLWMLRVALNQLSVSFIESSEETMHLKNAVLISLQEQNISTFVLKGLDPFIPISINEYPKKGRNHLMVSSVRHFTGCEHSIVFVDLNSAFFNEHYEIECLTRTLGQMVILDGGCFNEKVENYEQKIKKIWEAEEAGVAEIREIDPSTEDMKTMKKLLIDYLGHELERMRIKADIAKRDGFSDRFFKAQEKIARLEEQQEVERKWLIENK